MTQPTDKPPSEGDPALLERLKGTSNEAVGEAARAVTPYTEDDEAHERRKTKSESKKNLAKIKAWFFWFLFWTTCIVISVCALGYLYLIWTWLGTLLYGTTVHDAAALKSFIDGVLWTLLVIFATLFFEGVFKEKD
ncbi:hypothetical protein ACFSCV_10160 [Methylopila henanensis]|uniref:Uncharacterized protein n=1 Tax=Methylopila henanensis TaxID=873516 RepID=A0ABW4K783_9HYPH